MMRGTGKEFLKTPNESPRVESNGTDVSTRFVGASRQLAVAERAYRTWAIGRTGVVEAFVAGSAAFGEASSSADVDLRVVVEGVSVPKAYFALSDDVPIEWRFVPKSNYADDEAVLVHPFRAVEVAECVLLDDPSGYLTSLRERLRPKYERGVYRRRRAGTLLACATSAFGRVQEEHRTRGVVSLWAFRCALFWSVEAALARVGLRPTHRRGLVVLRDALRELGAESLHERALDAFGARWWSGEDVFAVWTRLRRRLRTAPVEALTHPYLARDRLPLWDAGFAELVRDGDAREAALPVWTLLALSWTALPATERESLADLWKACAMERPYGVVHRLEATRRWFAELRVVLDADEGMTGTVEADE
jgi:hypothetical protein